MTYETFKETLLSQLKDYFPPETDISIHKIQKNNQLTLDGLTILEPGYNIAPTIYIEHFFERLESGASFIHVFQEILDMYFEYRPVEDIDTSLFCDFDYLHDKIAFKVINYEMNKELLSNIPHIQMEDLAIVFFALMLSSELGNASMLIQNHQINQWGISLQQLYDLAFQNTPKLLPYQLTGLNKMIEIMKEELKDEFPDDMKFNTISALYILTNKQRYHGAACMFYKDILLDFSKEINSDFYIIPSSIHEVILVPIPSDMDPDDCNDLIKEVNRKLLWQEEYLSDHVYYFRRDNQRITMENRYIPSN